MTSLSCNSSNHEFPLGVPATLSDPLSCLNFAGAICEFTCPPGTFPQSPQSLILVCQMNGTWSRPIPQCSPFPPTPPTQSTSPRTPAPSPCQPLQDTIDNGAAEPGSFCSQPKADGKCIYKCNPGE